MSLLLLAHLRSVRSSHDPFKRIVYCIIGGCDPVDNHPEVKKVPSASVPHICFFSFLQQTYDSFSAPPTGRHFHRRLLVVATQLDLGRLFFLLRRLLLRRFRDAAPDSDSTDRGIRRISFPRRRAASALRSSVAPHGSVRSGDGVPLPRRWRSTASPRRPFRLGRPRVGFVGVAFGSDPSAAALGGSRRSGADEAS